MNHPLYALSQLLEEGKRLVLARIIRQVGSAPRSIGTSCMILEDGSLVGTIGGGLLEYQVVERAKAVHGEGRSAVLHFTLQGEDVAKTEMICGGVADVYLEPLFPENETVREVFSRTRDLLAEGKGGTLFTLVAEGLSFEDEACRMLVAPGGRPAGAIRGLGGNLVDSLLGQEGKRKADLLELHEGGPWIFAEPIKAEDVLYIFGAGHISTFLAPLARMVGFKVVVLDDREEFANTERFPNADEIRVAPFDEAVESVLPTRCSYVAIITRGHIHDGTVLRAALPKDLAYIGMIGSRRKRDLLYQSLREEGFSEERLKQVHSPIGLAIGAETPEEIAVSIVAELIDARSRRCGAKAR